MTTHTLFSRSGALALLIGALVAIQSRMNGALAVALGDSLLAAVWSFGSGFVVIAAVAAVRPAAREGLARVADAVRSGNLRPWQLLGGVMGALFVYTQSYAVGPLGVAAFTVAVVAGQSAAALVVDAVGLGPAGRQHVTVGRVVAAGLAGVGVAVAMAERVDAKAMVIVIPAVVTALIGALSMVQAAINGRVNVASQTVLATTFLNFCFGTVTLIVLKLIDGFQVPDLSEVRWWMVWGGICGLVYVSLLAVLVKRLGMLWTLIGVLVGQMAGAVVLDVTNPALRHVVTPLMLTGLMITLVAAGLATYVAGRAAAAARPPAKA